MQLENMYQKFYRIIFKNVKKLYCLYAIIHYYSILYRTINKLSRYFQNVESHVTNFCSNPKLVQLNTTTQYAVEHPLNIIRGVPQVGRATFPKLWSAAQYLSAKYMCQLSEKLQRKCGYVSINIKRIRCFFNTKKAAQKLYRNTGTRSKKFEKHRGRDDG